MLFSIFHSRIYINSQDAGPVNVERYSSDWRARRICCSHYSRTSLCLRSTPCHCSYTRRSIHSRTQCQRHRKIKSKFRIAAWNQHWERWICQTTAPVSPHATARRNFQEIWRWFKRRRVHGAPDGKREQPVIAPGQWGQPSSAQGRWAPSRHKNFNEERNEKWVSRD